MKVTSQKKRGGPLQKKSFRKCVSKKNVIFFFTRVEFSSCQDLLSKIFQSFSKSIEHIVFFCLTISVGTAAYMAAMAWTRDSVAICNVSRKLCAWVACKKRSTVRHTYTWQVIL